MSLSHSPKIVTNGLVLCLDAADKKSYPGTGTLWTDRSGNGNNGTLVGGPTYSSNNKGSLIFDGIDDKVDLPYNPSLNIQGLNLTISCWITSTALASVQNGAGILVRNGESNDGLYELLLVRDSGKNYSYFRMKGVGFYNPKLIPIELNRIYNIVSVYDNGKMRNYVNSIEEGTGSISNISITASSFLPLLIGLRFVVTDSKFSGNIYNLSLYNRALTPQEITQNFNATRGRYGI
jgi:hypothetical protein